MSFNLTTRDPDLLATLAASLSSRSFAGGNGAVAPAPACVRGYAVRENLLRRFEPAISDSDFTPIPVRIILSAQGRVKHVHVIRSTAEQRKSIEHALSQWQFRPYQVDERAVELETGLVFRSKQMEM